MHSAWLIAALTSLAVACGDDTGPGASGGGGSSGGPSTGGTSAAGGEGGGVCADDCQGFSCCGTSCVNKMNDIHNCGGCGVICDGPHPYCDMGNCGPAPCDPLTDCAALTTCCGTSCCTEGQLCCEIPGPVGSTIGCTDPTPEGTCPTGCVLCKCAAGDTMIATPDGERPLSTIQVGDLVYSVDQGTSTVVPVLIVQRNPVVNHRVMEVKLVNGRVLHVSGKHPTADGRTFDQLAVGDDLGGAGVVSVHEIPFEGDATYDILPASSSGTYLADGALIASTLRGRVDVRP